MRDFLTRTATRLHNVTLGICLAMLAVMFGGQVIVVLLRYLMGVGFLELQDSVTYSFSIFLVLTVPLAVARDRHVRVDIFRNSLSRSRNNLIDALGHLAFSIPVFTILIWTAWPLVRNSWAILEGSRETGGLPGLFLVKTSLIIMCGLILVHTLAQLFPETPVHQSGAEDEQS